MCDVQTVHNLIKFAVLQTTGLNRSRSSILTEWAHTLYTHNFAETSYWHFVCTTVHQVSAGSSLLWVEIWDKIWDKRVKGLAGLSVGKLDFHHL